MSVAGKVSETRVTAEDGDRKASKVSKLREMFQTGSVRPVEDWENDDITEEELRLLRQCPGSPPLLSLRERCGASSAITSAQKPTVPNGGVPPARPPKPHDLWLKYGLTPRHLFPSPKSRISPRLWKAFAVFESSGTSSAPISVSSKSVPTKADSTALSKPAPDSRKDTHLTAEIPVQPQAFSSVTESPNATANSTFKPDVVECKTDVSSADLADLSSRFIEQNSSTEFSLDVDNDLQHAEPVAVSTPDEDEDEESVENEMQRLGLTTIPQLKPPTGLKIVAVDSLGAHILEDGNFFYASPGIFAQKDLPEDSNQNTLNMNLSDTDTPRTDVSYSIPGPDDGSSAKRVRFSAEPILVFSTHSIEEYDRKNDDIDPVAASAMYELEKRLETMELFEVDLEKSNQKLGLSFVCMGPDVPGRNHLGIFVGSVLPGGAADLSQKVQPKDQIVEVDNINMVGVSYEFALKTIRNTGDTVHFVFARSSDPENLWKVDEPDGGSSDNNDSPNRSRD